MSPKLPVTPQTIALLESTRSVLRRSAHRAYSIGQFAAAVKWHSEAQALECKIDEMRAERRAV